MNRLQLVSKITAELAFHLGYTWKTDYDYYFLLNNDNSDEFKLYSPSEIWHIEPKNKLICPQQHLLQKWLRELHDLHIIINCYLKDGTSHFDYIIQELQTFNQIVHAGESGSYEETLEYALYRCLLIIKDKNGNKTE